MALETRLYQRLAQQLVMTPQLRQAIKILQESRLELETHIQQEMAENPVLEEVLDEREGESGTYEDGDGAGLEGVVPAVREAVEPERATEVLEQSRSLADIDWKEFLENYANNFHGSEGGGVEDDEDRRPSVENASTGRPTLTEHLSWQLRLADIPEEERAMAVQLVGNLDEDGFLPMPLDEVAARLGVPLELAERVLARIQELDPPGVGARDLRECLLIQLRQRGLGDSLAATLVRDHLGALESKRFDRVARDLQVSLEEISAAVKLIAKLDPRPGRDFGEGDVRYVTPDVFVHKLGDEYVVTLNDEGLPRLRVSNYYLRLLRQEGSTEAKAYVQEKMRSAAWLIKSIQQRQRTMYMVTQSIVKFQRAFLEGGVSHLRPLVLKDVASDIGMHESTVSRATANKYVHTPRGTFELKYFFTSSVRSCDGEQVSAESVKERIRQIIGSEDPRKPLSDEHIARALAEENIGIARRTVAKYREMMGILPSSKRRQI